MEAKDETAGGPAQGLPVYIADGDRGEVKSLAEPDRHKHASGAFEE